MPKASGLTCQPLEQRTQGESAVVESTDQAKAEAVSRVESTRIEAVEAAKLKTETSRIESELELESLKAATDAETGT